MANVPRVYRTVGNSLLRLLAFAVIAVIAAIAAPQSAHASAPRWLDMPVDAALKVAKKANKRLFVKFEASWCGPCRRLGALLDEPAGREVMKGVLGVRVDFDDEANRKYIKRYVVLGLPTVMVLDPSGTQVSRIAGFDDRDAWLAEARAAKIARDPLPALQDAVQKRPDDPQASLRLGKALLGRGRIKAGLVLIERTGWLATTKRPTSKNTATAAEALFVLGRFHHRVQRDPKTAQHIWRELATRYPASDFAGGAWWWYARSQHELARDSVAIAALKARCRREPGNLSAIRQWGKFIAKYKLARHVKDAVAALDAVMVGRSGAELDKLAALKKKLLAIPGAAKPAKPAKPAVP